MRLAYGRQLERSGASLYLSVAYLLFKARFSQAEKSVPSEEGRTNLYWR
jgi:hypothetical protein